MSEFIAEAQVLIVPNVAGFAVSLRKQVEAAVLSAGPIAIPVVAATGGAAAATAAQAELTTAVRAATVATEQEVGVLSGQAAAASASAAATKAAALEQRKLAAATAVQAKKLGQLERGAASAGLTMFGLRGATLAASGAFLAGAAGVALFQKSIAEASNETEQLNKTREVFGQFAEDVEKFAETSARGFGESRASALELASTFGALLRPIGFTQSAAAEMSVSLTKLGADLASFFNTDVADALAAIQSGLVGQVRPLRRYGIEVSAARVQATALAETGKTVAKELTNQEKVAARVALIFKDSAIAQGDFARTSGEFANQTRILAAEAANLEGALGRLAVPVLSVLLRELTTGLGIINRFADGLGRVSDAARDVARDIKSIPKGKLLLPEVPKDQGGAAGLRGFLGDIADFERNVSKIPAFFSKTMGPVQSEAKKTAEEVQKIFVAARSEKSIAQFNGDMRELIETLRDGDPEQQKAAERVQALADAVSRLGHLPGPKEFKQLMKDIGVTVDGTGGSIRNLSEDLIEAARRFRGTADAALNLKAQLRGVQVESSAAAAALLRIQSEGGGAQAQLPAARKQLAADQDVLNAALALSPSKKGRAAAVKAAREALVADRALIESLTGEITSASEKAAADAKKRVDDAARKQAEATAAFIESFSSRGDKLERALARAASNDNFRKQIAINKAIIANDIKEIAALRDRIKHLHLHGEALKAAAAAIQAAQREIQDARDAIADAQAARKAALEDIINQRLDLRIQLAQARDNVLAEIKARQARLANITKQLAKLKNAGKKNTLAWLELKVQQAEEIKAINELKKTTDAKKNAQDSAFFSFLQTQSGFAANLLGNLIPGFATAGLVGNAPQASQAAFQTQPRVAQESAVATSRDRGVRPVQVDTTNQILRQILAALNGRHTQPPEIKHNRGSNSAFMDTLGGMGD